MVIVLYLLLGAASGVLAGLFGVGGGVILVPALVYALQLQGFAAQSVTHIAVATSLAIICVTSISSARAHHKNGLVLWQVFKALSPGIVFGVVVGTYCIRFISGPWLQFSIGVFLLLVALRMFFGVKPANYQLPKQMVLVFSGSVIGFASSLFGIGGGSLTVPLLSKFGITMQKAVATSAACGVTIAFAATFTNAWYKNAALANTDLALGNIYLPALFGVALMSAPFAKVGANLAKNLDALLLKRLFSVFVVLVGISLMKNSWELL